MQRAIKRVTSIISKKKSPENQESVMEMVCKKKPAAEKKKSVLSIICKKKPNEKKESVLEIICEKKSTEKKMLELSVVCPKKKVQPQGRGSQLFLCLGFFRGRNQNVYAKPIGPCPEHSDVQQGVYSDDIVECVKKSTKGEPMRGPPQVDKVHEVEKPVAGRATVEGRAVEEGQIIQRIQRKGSAKETKNVCIPALMTHRRNIPPTNQSRSNKVQPAPMKNVKIQPPPKGFKNV